MGQIISFLWKWIYPKSTNNGSSRVDHDPQPNHEAISLIDDEISGENQQENHIIDIPDTVNQIVDDLKSGFEEVVKRNKRQKRKKKKEEQVVLEKRVTTSVSNVVVPRAITAVRNVGQYNSRQRILLVGEGNFSFSACLAVAFGNYAANIVATSLNSQEFLIQNYEMFPTNSAVLENNGSTILHDVNATTMAKHYFLSTMLFDRVVFNFPHAGKFGHSYSELRLHKNLVRGFLRNAKKMINEDGEIHVTSKSNGFYLNWDIPKIGSDQGLQLVQEIKFKRSKYRGYNTKYGFGGDKNFDCNPSKTYKFSLSLK